MNNIVKQTSGNHRFLHPQISLKKMGFFFCRCFSLFPSTNGIIPWICDSKCLRESGLYVPFSSELGCANIAGIGWTRWLFEMIIRLDQEDMYHHLCMKGPRYPQSCTQIVDTVSLTLSIQSRASASPWSCRHPSFGHLSSRHLSVGQGACRHLSVGRGACRHLSVGREGCCHLFVALASRHPALGLLSYRHPSSGWRSRHHLSFDCPSYHHLSCHRLLQPKSWDIDEHGKGQRERYNLILMKWVKRTLYMVHTECQSHPFWFCILKLRLTRLRNICTGFIFRGRI